MGDYQYLTAEDEARIIAEVQAQIRTPEDELRAHEAAHFRAVIEAKAGLHEPPDEYLPPDVSEKEAAKVVLDGEAAKLPAVLGVEAKVV